MTTDSQNFEFSKFNLSVLQSFSFSTMKHLLSFLFLWFSFLAQAANYGDQVVAKDQVTHVQEVYKTIDTFNLKIDI